jgi:hypothetical protein
MSNHVYVQYCTVLTPKKPTCIKHVGVGYSPASEVYSRMLGMCFAISFQTFVMGAFPLTHGIRFDTMNVSSRSVKDATKCETLHPSVVKTRKILSAVSRSVVVTVIRWVCMVYSLCGALVGCRAGFGVLVVDYFECNLATTVHGELDVLLHLPRLNVS